MGPPKTVSNPFFTIGHSTRPIDEFVALLTAAEVRLVVDVRTVPRSRTNPQFNRDALPASLAAHGVAYEHFAALGGFAESSLAYPPTPTLSGRTQAFTTTPTTRWSEEFRSAVEKLRALGHATRSTVMCAESLWWRCHRRIIADYLIAAGEEVFHILGPGHVEQARLTPEARVEPDGTTNLSEGHAARARPRAHEQVPAVRSTSEKAATDCARRTRRARQKIAENQKSG